MDCDVELWRVEEKKVYNSFCQTECGIKMESLDLCFEKLVK